MSIVQDFGWFKGNFGTTIAKATVGTPFTIDMLAAIAYQETGKEIWGPLSRKGLPAAEILKLCTGDIIDYPKRASAWPKNKAELLTHPQGVAMFQIARAAFVAMAAKIPAYQPYVSNQNKFCHGFGMFQYDIQFFENVDSQYFLKRDYEIFENTLAKCILELKVKQKTVGLGGKLALTDMEMAMVAIAYNKGSYNPAKLLKQGHSVTLPGGAKKYYGEFFIEYLKEARNVSFSPPVALPSKPVPPPTPITAQGKAYIVNTVSDPLSLRSSSNKPVAGQKNNLITAMPRMTEVRAINDTPVNGFLEVEVSLQGALYRGFAAASLLKLISRPTVVSPDIPTVLKAPISFPTQPKPASGKLLPEVHLKRKPGAITARKNLPTEGGAYPLNEVDMPKRSGGSAASKAAELGKIIAYLDNENKAHKRYQPTPNATFCNLYAHDFCTMAGCYLPRVWWTSKAITRLLSGEIVEPAYGATVNEMRANALFQWLSDYSLDYGWRRTSTLTKLQDVANLGGVGIICARNKVEGKSGHIVIVVPETAHQKAKRNSMGDVNFALQSQAGRINFRYGTSGQDWWLGKDFSMSGFWVHD